MPSLPAGRPLAALLALLPACVVPEGARPQVTYGADLATAYVHRGMTQNETGVLQPSLLVALPAKQDGRILTRAWGNVDLSDDTGDAWLPDGHGGRFSQIDFDVLYEQLLGDYVLTMGFVSYNLPNGLEFPFGERGATAEVLVEGSTVLPERFWSLQPTLSIHYDVDEVDGLYLRGSLARAFRLDERWSAEVELGLGWMDENQSAWNYAQSPPSSGLADLTLAGTFSYAFDEHTTGQLFAAWSDVVDSDYSEWIESLGIDDSIVWVGTGIRWTY